MDPMTSFVSAMMAAQAMSSCFTESPSSYKAENGTLITYCNYKGEKKFPGNKWTSKECEKCSCTADEGLKCCKAGQHHVSYTNVNGDSECVQKKEGCEIKWVYRDNQNKACPQSKIPTPAKTSEAKPAETPFESPFGMGDDDKMFSSESMDNDFDTDHWDHDFDEGFDGFGDHDDFFDDHHDRFGGFDDDFWKD